MPLLTSCQLSMILLTTNIYHIYNLSLSKNVWTYCSLNIGCSTYLECWTFKKYPDTHAVGAAGMPGIANVSHCLVSTFNTHS